MQLIMDIAVIFIGYCLANLIFSGIRGSQIFTENMWIYIVFSVVFTLSMLLMRMYNVTTFYYMDRIIKRTLTSGVISGLTLTSVIFMAKLENMSRLLFLLVCVISCMMIISERIILRYCKKNKIGGGYKQVIFIGDDDTYRRYTTFLDNTAIRLVIVKFINYNDRSLLEPETFSRLLMDLSVDEVQFVHALEGSQNSNCIKELLHTCDSMGVTARIILDAFDLPVSKRYVHSVGTYPVITYHSVSLDRFQMFIKSVIDMMGAAVGLVLLSPIFLLTAIAIKIDSPGPVFFIQKRVGINGNKFNIYKFRSMYKNAEERKKELLAMNKIKDGMMFKMDNDPRITKVGRFIRKSSIDELPQLINVLKREMSLVGTRPPTMDEVKKYSPDQWRRISILPGITGMWQVNGRSQILDFDDVVKLDKRYIDEWSLLLDFKIMLQTVKVVLTTQGAS